MLEEKNIKNYIGRTTNFKTATFLLKKNGFKQVYFEKFFKNNKEEFYCVFNKDKIFILIETKEYKINRFQVYMEIYNRGKFSNNWNEMSNQKGLVSLKKSSPCSFVAIINFPFNTFEFIKTWETEIVGNLNKSKFPSLLNSTENKDYKQTKFEKVFNSFPITIQNMFH